MARSPRADNRRNQVFERDGKFYMKCKGKMLQLPAGVVNRVVAKKVDVPAPLTLWQRIKRAFTKALTYA